MIAREFCNSERVTWNTSWFWLKLIDPNRSKLIASSCPEYHIKGYLGAISKMKFREGKPAILECQQLWRNPYKHNISMSKPIYHSSNHCPFANSSGLQPKTLLRCVSVWTQHLKLVFWNIKDIQKTEAKRAAFLGVASQRFSKGTSVCLTPWLLLHRPSKMGYEMELSPFRPGWEGTCLFLSFLQSKLGGQKIRPIC